MIDIEKNFTYHAPRPDQISLYTEIRFYAKKLAELFEMNCLTLLRKKYVKP